VTSELEVNFNNMRYINLHFTYFLLTYLQRRGHSKKLYKQEIWANAHEMRKSL